MNLFKLVLIELWHRKSQLVSGLLAITLGIGVIVGIRSFSVVSEKAVAVNLDNLGANIMVLPQAASVDNYYSADIDAPTFPESYVERIVTSSLPGVDNLSPKLTRRLKIGNESIVLTGILPKSEIASKPIWQQGGLFADKIAASCAPKPGAEPAKYLDERLQRKGIDSLAEADCFIGSVIAQRLNLKEKDKLNIEGKDFTVVNVLPETGTVDDDRVFANLHTVQELLGTGEQISAIEIMGCCSEISDGLLGKLRNVLPDTRITTIGQIVSTQIETNKMMNKISFVFLIIILFVGGISIGNYIWANVNERRKEIGILRMIGYHKRHVYFILVLKGIIIGFLGGIAGYILGTFGAIWLGPQFAGIEVAPIYTLILVSVVISVSVSIIGTVIPAYMAGKIEPFSNMQEE
ncbi:MAG: ABC transporter permease [Bacteroidales bacterium]|nr:ABC transporter permease [Bacteroidales bacterium]MCF8457923.1 ABC transporter permease [Bacteroidales bacterium]